MKRAGLILIALVMSVVIYGLIGTGTALAAPPPAGSSVDPLAAGNNQVCVSLPIFKKAPPGAGAGCPAGQQAIPNDQDGGAIVYYLKELLRLVNTLIGAIIILAIIVSGIQYMISGGDPANVKKAKGHLTNAFTALILYMLMVAILNFLVPGGAL